MPAGQSYRGPVIGKRAEAEACARPSRQARHEHAGRRRRKTEHAGLPGAVGLALVTELRHEAGDRFRVGRRAELGLAGGWAGGKDRNRARAGAFVGEQRPLARCPVSQRGAGSPQRCDVDVDRTRAQAHRKGRRGVVRLNDGRGWCGVWRRGRRGAENGVRLVLAGDQQHRNHEPRRKSSHGGRSLDWVSPIAPVAHRTERSAPDRKAAGSIPARRTFVQAGESR